ncbi:MAG: Outer membrane autotransporter barrel domain-containing protein [Candidatus Tokpelaia hoelldobleri]|uniref:Outer membrane autotransporter barrel domain-containing protein n=1 Tax=Candidatus Tokpelaia hoelldobleri TaxID=1902579 RepID=A0A1U9JWH5_9HYPH|nr:MAG: Outer membrane autotransporter barrel domain-containing protein [Candidatus Tokpelaia hoelldoblerii]
MKKYLLAASAVALIAANGAQAADVVTYQQPVAVATAPAFSWQGFYAGGQIGGSWGDTDVKTRAGAVKTKRSVDPDGFIGGLYAGYNFDAGNNIILGLETDFVWGDLEEKKRGTDYTARLKQEWQGATRVRAGYAMDRFLPYVAAGVAYGKVKSSLTEAGNADNRWSDDDTFTGWTICAGLDYAVTDNILVRLEYRYTDLGDKSYRPAAAFGVDRVKVDYTSNDFRVGVAYKF